MKTRWNWGHGIAAVYIVFATGTLGFAVYAMEQRVDLVSDDYYDQSVALDARRTAESNARALGAAFAITQVPGQQHATVQWPAETAANAAGTLTLYRPADATADRHTPMAPNAAHTQTVALNGLAPGRWMLQVEWTAGGRAFYAEREVLVVSAAR